MDIKASIVQRIIDISGNLIADQLSKSDWESRKSNIEQYYKDLQPIRETLPDAPDVREIPEQRGIEQTKMGNLIEQVCAGLTGEERTKCEEAVREFMENPKSMDKYLSSR